jgi:hypothetical protein
MNGPSCETCRYFVPGRYPRTDTCARFIAYRGRGKVVYEWADSVRFNENKCGASGRLYISKEKNKSRERHETLLSLLNDDE